MNVFGQWKITAERVRDWDGWHNGNVYIKKTFLQSWEDHRFDIIHPILPNVKGFVVSGAIDGMIVGANSVA